MADLYEGHCARCGKHITEGDGGELYSGKAPERVCSVDCNGPFTPPDTGSGDEEVGDASGEPKPGTIWYDPDSGEMRTKRSDGSIGTFSDGPAGDLSALEGDPAHDISGEGTRASKAAGGLAEATRALAEEEGGGPAVSMTELHITSSDDEDDEDDSEGEVEELGYPRAPPVRTVPDPESSPVIPDLTEIGTPEPPKLSRFGRNIAGWGGDSTPSITELGESGSGLDPSPVNCRSTGMPAFSEPPDGSPGVRTPSVPVPPESVVGGSYTERERPSARYPEEAEGNILVLDPDRFPDDVNYDLYSGVPVGTLKLNIMFGTGTTYPEALLRAYERASDGEHDTVVMDAGSMRGVSGEVSGEITDVSRSDPSGVMPTQKQLFIEFSIA